MLNLNSLVQPLLTDLYQITMAYAYWKNRVHEAPAVFDLFFRKNPFDGEFTVCAGLEEAIRFVTNFKFTDSDIAYLRDGLYQTLEAKQAEFETLLQHGLIKKDTEGYQAQAIDGTWHTVEYPQAPSSVRSVFQDCDPDFFKWLKDVDCSQVKIHAIPEGTLVFPKIPLLTVEGPVAICQLLETTLLNLVNYASLVATNAARFRLAAGPDKLLVEFGLRRAQGPDGALSSSEYCYLGGFDATSNVLAGKLLGMPVRGTHAHSFVSSFMEFEDLPTHDLVGTNGQKYDFVAMVKSIRTALNFTRTNTGELAAFIAYAQSFPNSFLALVDTYDTLHSGVPNFICVAIALLNIGYKPLGIRLDSGDLAYLSKEACHIFKTAFDYYQISGYKPIIMASNDINEETLYFFK